MAQIVAYLKFNNNCREAVTFYKECFGGKLTFNTVKGSPIEQHMKREDGQKVLHSSLIGNDFSLFAFEMTNPTVVGDTIFLWLNCKNEEEIKSIFDKLSVGGTITAEVQPVYWGTFGSITDKRN